MYWIGIVAFLVVAGIAAIWYLRDAEPVPSREQIGVETLEATLEDAGVEQSSTRIPNVDILQPYISERDEFLGAVQARRGNKHSILVALGDRLVAGESTLGSMGAEVITVTWEEIDELEQSYDIGGELRVVTGREQYTYTHLPRSQTREFVDLVERRIEKKSGS